MTTRQIMFVSLFFTSVITAESQQKGFVFDRGMFTEINGNILYAYIHFKHMNNPSYVFKHTRVIECTKDKKLTEIGTLGSLQKVHQKLRQQLPWESSVAVNRLEKFAKMNNAVCCYAVEQKLNYFDKLEDVSAIMYGTQDVEDCALLKEYLKQQELATKK